MKIKSLFYKLFKRKQFSSESYKELKKQLKAELLNLVEEHKKDKKSSHVYLALRSKHIAYSMFRAKSFNEIEHKWKDPDFWVNTYVKAEAKRLHTHYKLEVKQRDADKKALYSSP